MIGFFYNQKHPKLVDYLKKYESIIKYNYINLYINKLQFDYNFYFKIECKLI